jgi:hypothetical protein
MTTISILALFLQLAPLSNQDSTFTKAITDRSTNPYFILITVVDDSANTSQLITTEAPFLLGAIHIEKSIPYSESGSAQVEKIALSNTEHIFHFKRREALKNIGLFYNVQILADIKKRLGSVTREDLLKQLKSPDSQLHKIYRERGKSAYIPYRNAIAHILLENGITVRRNSHNANLFTE